MFTVLLLLQNGPYVFKTLKCNFECSIPGRVKQKKNQYLQLPCLLLALKRDSLKPPPCVVDR